MCGASTTAAIGDKPAAVTNSTTAAFTFTSTPAGCTFMCSLDSGPFMTCAATFSTTVALGTHTLQVKAGSGTATAMYTWVVDTAAPETTAVCPALTISNNEVSIALTSSEAMSTFRCKFDSEAEADCTSPFTRSGLSVAAHTLTVFAVDKAGNKDPSAVVCPFTVTDVSVQTKIITCPPAKNKSNTATVEFTIDPAAAGATYSCKLNTAAAEPNCTSPKTYNNLQDGDYTFTVAATLGGKTDPSPGECKFAIDTKAPTVVITSPDNGAMVPPTVTFTYTVDDPTATLACAFKGENVPCGADHTFTAKNLEVGQYTFSVTATDSFGNVGSDTATVNVVPGPFAEIHFAPIDAEIVGPNGTVVFSHPNSTSTTLKDVCVVKFGSSTSTLDPCTSPIPWMNLKDKDPIRVEITTTDTALGVTGPTVVRTGTVDAHAPLPIITQPSEDVVQPLVTLEFVEGSPIEIGPVVWMCEGPQGPFTCSPGQPVDVGFALSDGSYSFKVTGTDKYGNKGTAEKLFEVDGTGPYTRTVSVPDGEVCPFSSNLGEKITFEEAPNPFSGLFEKHGPVTFQCALDVQFAEGDPTDLFEDCTVDDGKGEFTWFNLDAPGPSHKEHTVTIVAFDDVGEKNPGPPLVVPFVVDRAPPLPFTITIDNAIVKTNLVTSGDSSINIGQPYLIHVTATDLNHPPPVLVSITIDGQACDGDPCILDHETGGSGTTHDWFYTFKGLSDGDHTVTVVVKDQCDDVNVSPPKSLTWTVDAVANVVSFLPFDAPTVDNTDPTLDVTSSSNVVHFQLYDNDTPNSPNELPHTVTCTFADFSGTQPPIADSCVQDGDPTTPAVTIDYKGPFSGFDDGLASVTVHAVDEVGNVTPNATKQWCVDTAQPTISFTGNSPQVNTCITADPDGDGPLTGRFVTLPNGTVNFTTTDNGPACGTANFKNARCHLEFFGSGGVDTTPVVVTGYDDLDCSDGSFEFGTARSTFSALPDGHYRLTVTAFDNVNPTKPSSKTRDFEVDGTFPVVTFTVPGIPTPVAGAEAGATIFQNIQDNNTTDLSAPGGTPTADPALHGTFTTVFDPSTQVPSFMCSINGGTPVACSNPLTYDTHTLAEAVSGYTVTVTGQDCVNHAVPNTPKPDSLNFFIDQNGPRVSVAPNCGTNGIGGGAGCTITNATNTVAVTFTLIDDITNIDHVECLLDHDANGANPETLSASPAYQLYANCAAQYTMTATPTLPTAPAGDLTRPRPANRTSQITVTFDKLAPGRHKFWYRGVDTYGHKRGTPDSIEFVVDKATDGTNEVGQAIAIGHDYTTMTQDTANLLGNAVLKTSARLLGRPSGLINIIALDIDGVAADDDALDVQPDGGIGVGTPKANVQLAITDRVAPGNSVQFYEWGGNASLADEEVRARLYGQDVLLIYDQNGIIRDSDGGTQAAFVIGAKTAWLAAITEFLNNGGVVVLLDGQSGQGGLGAKPQLLTFTSNTINILGYAEIWNTDDGFPQDQDINIFDSASGPLPFRENALLDCRTNDSLGSNVGTPVGDPLSYEVQHYEIPQSSVIFEVDAQANEIFSAEFARLIVECPDVKECIPRNAKLPQDQLGGRWFPTVMQKTFTGSGFKNGLRTAVGPARTQAVAEFQFRPRDEDSFAIYSDSTGKQVGFCRLREDGTATHDLPDGGSISIASEQDANIILIASGAKRPGTCDGVNFGGDLNVETTFAVKLFDEVWIGGPVDRSNSVNVNEVTVELPIFDSTLTNLTYYVTNGCTFDTIDKGQFEGSTVPLQLNPFKTRTDCLANDGSMSFLAWVRDDSTGLVLAYTQLFGVPQDSTCDHTAPNPPYYCVDAAKNIDDTNVHWPHPPVWGVQPLKLQVEYDPSTSFDPPATDELASLLLGPNTLTGFGLEEGMIDPEAETYFSPVNPFDKFNNLRIDALVYNFNFNRQQFGSGSFSVARRMTDEPIPSQGITSKRTIKRTDIMARVLDASGDVSPTTFSWKVDQNASLADADAQFGRMAYNAGTCPSTNCPTCCPAFWNGTWAFVGPVATPNQDGMVNVVQPTLPTQLSCYRGTDGGQIDHVGYFGVTAQFNLGFYPLLTFFDTDYADVTWEAVRHFPVEVFTRFFAAPKTHTDDLPAAGTFQESNISTFCGNFCGTQNGNSNEIPRAGDTNAACYVPLTLIFDSGDQCD